MRAEHRSERGRQQDDDRCDQRNGGGHRHRRGKERGDEKLTRFREAQLELEMDETRQSVEDAIVFRSFGGVDTSYDSHRTTRESKSAAVERGSTEIVRRHCSADHIDAARVVDAN